MITPLQLLIAVAGASALLSVALFLRDFVEGLRSPQRWRRSAADILDAATRRRQAEEARSSLPEPAARKAERTAIR